MTIKELGVLSSNNVPARAMTVDAVLNLFLLTYFAGAIEIIAAGNLGYMLSHVFALTGFLLLRRDRPGWPRPIKLSAIWLPIAGLLAAANLLFIVVGGSPQGGRIRLRLGQDPRRPDRARRSRFCSGPSGTSCRTRRACGSGRRCRRCRARLRRRPRPRASAP